jgi:hypothetical protein
MSGEQSLHAVAGQHLPSATLIFPLRVFLCSFAYHQGLLALVTVYEAAPFMGMLPAHRHGHQQQSHAVEIIQVTEKLGTSRVAEEQPACNHAMLLPLMMHCPVLLCKCPHNHNSSPCCCSTPCKALGTQWSSNNSSRQRPRSTQALGASRGLCTHISCKR